MTQFFRNGGAGSSNFIIVSGETIGATTLDLITFPLNTSQQISIHSLINGFESATPNSIGGIIVGTAYRGAGIAILNGTPAKPGVNSTFATASFDLIVSVNNAIVRVTGQAGLTIEWNGIIQFLYI